MAGTDLAARLGIEIVTPPTRTAGAVADTLVLLALALIVWAFMASARTETPS